MQFNAALNFDPSNYHKRREADFIKQNIVVGLILGLVFYSVYIFFDNGLYDVLSFGVSFYDPSSSFAEDVIHLYNIVWTILIFVVFFILVLLIRIIYLFNWNFSYFSFDLYSVSTIIVLDFILFIGFHFENEFIVHDAMKRLNLVKTGAAGTDIGLNLWYNKDHYAFLSVSDLSEYRDLEVAWCLLPIGSLLAISSPTFSLIFSMDPYVDPAYTIKIIGRQWYWTYEVESWVDNYSYTKDVNAHYKLEDSNTTNVSVELYKQLNIKRYIFALPANFEFDGDLVSEEDLVAGQHRLLEVNNRLYLPVGVPIRLLITSSDVLHSWAVPSLGVKVDAVPGRLNQFIVELKRPGVFYGQCSELCGPYHGFMPIVVKGVPLTVFEEWMFRKQNLS